MDEGELKPTRPTGACALVLVRNRNLTAAIKVDHRHGVGAHVLANRLEGAAITTRLHLAGARSTART